MNVGWGIVGFLITLIITTTLGDLVSEELRSRLDQMPYAVLRLAIQRLPAELRPSVGDEWLAELHHILRQAKGRPLTQLVSAMRYALGLLRTARRIGQELRTVRTGAVPISRKPASGFPALWRVALVGGITASLVSVGITATDGAPIGITPLPISTPTPTGSAPTRSGGSGLKWVTVASCDCGQAPALPP